MCQTKRRPESIVHEHMSGLEGRGPPVTLDLVDTRLRYDAYQGGQKEMRSWILRAKGLIEPSLCYPCAPSAPRSVVRVCLSDTTARCLCTARVAPRTWL